MINKKKVCLILFLICFSLLPIVSAQLQIQKTAVTDSVIPEFKNPAIYNLKITNLGNTDIFRIYSLVGVDITPNQTYSIAQGETKEIQIQLLPNQQRLDNPGVLNFKYQISGQNSGIQEDSILIKIMDLKDAIEINSYNINLDADTATVYAKSLVDYKFQDITANFNSAFFDFSKTFSLDSYGKQEFQIALDKNKTKSLTAGTYSITTDITIQGLKERITNNFRFTEKADIETNEYDTGFIIFQHRVDKINKGNLPTVVQITAKKNIISRLFTSFNIEPSSVERHGFSVDYTFQKEIQPSETFSIKITTNWFYPLIIIIALIVIGYLIKLYSSSDVIVRKRANFVKTKGGEFALKVTIIVKARKYVSKINLVDRLPAMTKIFNKFMGIEPSRVDEQNRRIEWNIDNLQQYEERVVSYIIYSKIGVVGKYELPSATAIYEESGKLHESQSNKVFFLTETPNKPEY